MSTPSKTKALYQKDSTLTTHTTTITSLNPLSTLPPSTKSLFKPAPTSSDSDSASEPWIISMPSTIFHAQGGGQPSDTGTIVSTTTTSDPDADAVVFNVHQVRKVNVAILHMGTFSTLPLPSTPAAASLWEKAHVVQRIDREARLLHSRLHTAGHVLGLAIHLLACQSSSSSSSGIPKNITDGKASHYPNAAYVECIGLIPGSAKQAIQDKVDELVALDLQVRILYWGEEEARERCTAVSMEAFQFDGEEGVRVVEIGEVGRYPCGGTHVRSLKEVGRVVVRGVKRQKGVSKVGYGVVDA